MTSGIVLAPPMSTSTPKKKAASAKRCLFGKPDLALNDAFCARLLDDIMMEKCQQWDFDFQAGIPCASSSTFEYTQVPASKVPGFYRCTTMASSSRAPSSLDSSFSSDSENFDPSATADMDSSMDCDELSQCSMLSQPRATHTPKKFRESLHSRKRLSPSKKSASRKPYASATDSKITAHLSLRVSKRIVKKSVKPSEAASSSSGASFFQATSH